MNIVQNWFRRQFADPQVVMLVALLIAAFATIVLFGNMLAPVIGAIVVAFLLDGPADWLRKRGLSNLVSVALVFTLFLAFSVVAFFTILPPIAGQITQFAAALPDMFVAVQSAAMALPERFPGLINEAQVVDLIDGLRAGIPSLGQQLIATSFSGITNVVTLAVYAILVPVMVFFFLKDKREIIGWLAGLLPPQRKLSQQVWREVVARTGDYARGKVYEILIVGISAWIVFSLVLDLQFSLLLAVLTGVSVIVPYIGAALVTFPVAFVALVQWGFGPDFLLAVGLYLLLQALDGNMLVPWLFPRSSNCIRTPSFSQF